MVRTSLELLKENGYTIIPNILSDDEVTYSKDLFYEWYNTIDTSNNIDYLHKKLNPHNIFKYHQVGHQRFAWYIRTRKNVQDVFRNIWETDDLVVSFDGACYMKSGENNFSNNLWTHTDQAPKNKGFQCVQGFVALTDNKKASLLIYKQSHLEFENYFKEKKMEDNNKNWNIIEEEYLDKIKDNKIILEVPKGAMVIWDSRCFHQNVCYDNNEERIVQYVSMLPKEAKKNTPKMHEKRVKYFKELRTTSHWCYPIRVNNLQPRTYGEETLKIDYTKLKKPDLNDLMEDINRLL
jgi:ectoine hydroxylase-related dioxygenase (phytanoyl-CoA dioxygenase family)